MSALPETLAFRRLLHNYVVRLDEKIIELMSTESTITGGLASSALALSALAARFCEDNIIVWGNKQHVFSPSTYTLLQQFFNAPNRMLSKEDVRQDVLRDDDAREGSVRQCILLARKELLRTGFPCRIETITRKGYRLVAE